MKDRGSDRYEWVGFRVYSTHLKTAISTQRSDRPLSMEETLCVS